MVSITADIREFFQRCPARIIGITGTRGKHTTARLVVRMLQEAGLRVWLGGGGDRPLLDFLPKVKASDLVVLELSSLQLRDLNMSPHIAVCLMIAPDDPARQESVREYIAAKGNLFWHQRQDDVAIYDVHNDFSTQVAQLSPGRKIPFMTTPGAYVLDGRMIIAGRVICDIPELEFAESQMVESVCAAVTAAWEVLGDKPEPIRLAVQEFRAGRPRED